MKTRTRNVVASLALTIGLMGLSSGQAANAQFSWTDWRIPVGPVNIMENDLDIEMIQAFNTGLISPLEFTNLRRDLDGIRVQEEVLRAGDQGMGPWAEAHVLASLGRFRMTLENHESANKTVATVTTVTPGPR